MRGLRAPGLGDREHGDAPQPPAAQALVPGRVAGGDAQERHLGPAAVAAARARLLQDRLAAAPQAPPGDGRPRARAACRPGRGRGWRGCSTGCDVEGAEREGDGTGHGRDVAEAERESPQSGCHKRAGRPTSGDPEGRGDQGARGKAAGRPQGAGDQRRRGAARSRAKGCRRPGSRGAPRGHPQGAGGQDPEAREEAARKRAETRRRNREAAKGEAPVWRRDP